MLKAEAGLNFTRRGGLLLLYLQGLWTVYNGGIACRQLGSQHKSGMTMMMMMIWRLVWFTAVTEQLLIRLLGVVFGASHGHVWRIVLR